MITKSTTENDIQTRPEIPTGIFEDFVTTISLLMAKNMFLEHQPHNSRVKVFVSNTMWPQNTSSELRKIISGEKKIMRQNQFRH